MKQTTLTQRLLSALVALCMVLSVCAPAFADAVSYTHLDVYKRQPQTAPLPQSV